MIELTLLGLHAIRDSDGRELGSLPAQPKRFALLAYLVLAGGDGYLRRDSLAATFWPELDQFAARRALRNTLYHIREAVGEGALITQGDDALKVDPAVITSDVARLFAASAAGRYEEAVDLYRGELLAGMHLANAGEGYEEWLTRERARVVEQVVRALRALADRDEKAGDGAGAAYWAQRICALIPDDERVLRRAMSLHDAIDDRGGALRLYDSFARHLSIQFDATPSEESAALAARIRAGAEHRAPRAAAPTNDASPARDTVPTAAPVVAPETAAAPIPSDPPRRSRGGIAAAIAALIGAGIVVALVNSSGGSHARVPAPARTRVVVDVFENRTGDPHFASLGRMASDWLTQGLLRTQLVDVVDPRAVFVQGRASDGSVVDPVTLAHRTGATLVVSGNYYRTGDTLLFQASVTDAATGRIVRAVGPIGANVNAPVAALDQLRSRVMTALAAQMHEPGPRSLEGDVEIPPFEVYQSYVEGWDAYWHGDYNRATSLFLDASRRDTAFIGAAIAAATVASNSSGCAIVDSIARALTATPHRIERIQRLSLQIGVAHCHGRNEELLRLTLERAELAPRTSGMRISAAAAALYANRPERALQMLNSINPETDLSWTTDSSHFDYWSGLTEALHILGRHDDELRHATEMPNIAPLTRAWLRGRALAALRRPAEVLALVDTALTLQTETSNHLGLAPYTNGRPQYSATPAWVAVWIARELAVHGDSATSRQVAARAMDWYRGRAADERSSFEERIVAVWALELMGSYPQAEQMARSLLAGDSTNIDYRGMVAGLAAERGDSAVTFATDAWLSRQHGDSVSWTATYYRARDAALLGHRAEAVARLRESLDAGAWPMYLHVDPAFAILRGEPGYAALMTPRD
ncbi:MAG: BTAD domain-containing putative transcriptional regulator [Gemmatimonadaceae bacterium]